MKEIWDEIRENYKDLFENSSDLIFIYDTNGIFVETNDIFLQTLGYKKKDFQNLSINDLIEQSPSINLILTKIKDMKSIGQSELFEFRIRKKSKDYIYIETFGIPIIKDGTFYGILNIAKDITLRKQKEKLLKESERQYRHLYENASVSLWTLSIKDGKFIRANENTAKIAGYDSLDDFLENCRSEDLFSKEYRKKFFRELKDKGEISGFEANLFDKKGNQRYATVSAKIYTDEGYIEGVSTDITELKKIQKALQESEIKYRTLFENLPLSIVLLDQNGNYYDCNPSRIEYLGVEKEKIIGKSFKKHLRFLSKYEPIIDEAFKTVLQKGSIPEPLLVQIYNKYGNLRWIQINASLIQLAGKKLIQVISQDIDKKIRVEQNLIESEEKYRYLFEKSPFTIVLLELDGTILEFNPMLEKTFGYTKEDLIGKNFAKLNLIHPDYLSLAIKSFFKVVKDNILLQEEYLYYKKDGTLMWGLTQGTVIKLGDKKLVQTIIQDITDKKNAEENLIKSEEKFRRFFESIPDFYILISKDGKIIDYKGNEEDLIIKAEDFLNKKILDTFSKNLVKNGMDYIKKTIKSKQPSIIEYEVPIKDKTKYYEARMIYHSEDQVAVLIREITKRKRAEIIINDEVKRLKELEQIRRDLISRVSHELKTPLIPVISGSELLKTIYHDQLGKDAHEILDLIDKGGRRLKTLIEQLLNVSRIEYNKLKLDIEKHNLIDILKESVNDMKFLIEQRKISLNLDSIEEVFLHIDNNRIGEVFSNLLSNAIKNTPPGGRINIQVKKKKDWVFIYFKDNGVGLIDSEMKVLFTRFGKIDRYKDGLEYIDIRGSGLGLYICKEIVNLHGGQIWAESLGRNKGSTFIVKLPIE